MIRICHSLIGVLFAFLILGCESEKGVYLDHKGQEIRLNGERISTDKFVKFIADPTNAEVDVTILSEDGVKHTSAGELNEGLSALPSIFLSNDEPEAYFEPDDSPDGPDPFPDTTQQVEQHATEQPAISALLE